MSYSKAHGAIGTAIITTGIGIALTCILASLVSIFSLQLSSLGFTKGSCQEWDNMRDLS
jgi:hypothetical protein